MCKGFNYIRYRSRGYYRLHTNEGGHCAKDNFEYAITVAMIKLGNVYENMMINLRPTNEKLKRRMIRIVTEITGESEEESIKLLEQSDWDIRTAVQKNGKNT